MTDTSATKPWLSTHPCYNETIKDSMVARDFYLGGRNVLRTKSKQATGKRLNPFRFVDGESDTLEFQYTAYSSPYLIQHAEEDDRIYSLRCRRAAYHNYVRAPLQIYQAAIWGSRRI